ncbi:alpha/beta fold hydrolase [Eionea flava]
MSHSTVSSGALVSAGFSAIEKTFTFNGFRYAAQLWGDEGGLPVIALHGWLDNSGSFATLASQLPGVQCLAVDLAGHGLSDHKSGLDDYPIWTDISAIYAIADSMGWQHFGLLGHSRGAMMALLTAGTFPDRISHLVMIDAIMPPLVEQVGVIERIQKSIAEIGHRIERKATIFDSRREAIVARCMSRFAPVSTTTAEQLAVRGLSESAGKYSWRADSKLWSLSAIGLSSETLQAFVDNIVDAHVPSQLLLGDEGLVMKAPQELKEQSEALARQLSATVEVFNDGHFLHAESAATEVAAAIKNFLVSPR